MEQETTKMPSDEGITWENTSGKLIKEYIKFIWRYINVESIRSGYIFDEYILNYLFNGKENIPKLDSDKREILLQKYKNIGKDIQSYLDGLGFEIDETLEYCESFDWDEDTIRHDMMTMKRKEYIERIKKMPLAIQEMFFDAGWSLRESINHCIRNNWDINSILRNRPQELKDTEELIRREYIKRYLGL